MHPTTQRLYAALGEYLNRKEVGSTLAAQTLGLASAQTINNWEERGVSQAGMVKASNLCGIRTIWIERGENPMFEPFKPTLSFSFVGTHYTSDDIKNNWPDQKIQAALTTLENALINLGMAGRERLAPMFESFARSPGTVIKHDIAILLGNLDNNKSGANYEEPLVQKAG